MLGLGDDAPLPAPTVERAPSEVGKAARRAAPGQALGRGGGEIFGDRADQAVIAGEAEDVIDAAGLAPRHQLVAGAARIGAQHDPHPWPARADLADDAFDLGHGAGRGVEVGAPELGRQQVLTAEDVQRQIAVAVVIAVKEAAFLVAVQRIIGRIEVENDLLGRRLVRLEEDVDEQALALYSFDLLLPIIELHKPHYDIVLDGVTRYYFAFHKLMGYVLASFLIAGLAGLTK